MSFTAPADSGHTPKQPRLGSELRVLHAFAPARVGGLERVVQTLAVGHVKRGLDVRVAAVLSRGAPPHPVVHALREQGVPVEVLEIAARDYRAERAWIRELCERFRPDVVHTHGYRSDVVDGGVARSLHIPTLTTVHGFTGGTWRNRVYERIQRLIFRRFAAVVAVSQPLERHLLAAGIKPERLHLVRNAAPDSQSAPLPRSEARRRLGLPEHAFVAGWIGRVTREKGPDVFVRALAELADETRAVIIGEGRERRRLQDQPRARALGERIVWTGMIPDAGELLPAFDAFVLSSRTEGTPMVLFEAMAARVPIIATRVGGVPDVLGDAEALLVESEDTKALAAAISEVRRDPAAAQARADAAHAALARFSVDRWLDNYADLYRSLVIPAH